MKHIIHFITCNILQEQWDDKPTCISKSLTTVLFIPFTGMRFGLMQVKTGLCHILSRFEVAPCKETPVRIVYENKSFLLQTKGEIRLSFNRMQFWNFIYIYIFIYVYVYIYIYTHICTFIYLAGCATFLHLPAPIWQLYYLLFPFVSVIPVFFH